MSSVITFEKVLASEVSDEMINEAAQMFSSSYGVWGPLAAEKMNNKFCKPGKPVKMNKDRLRAQSLALGTDSVLVRAMVEGHLAGYAFATRWVYQGRKICWITQLCVGRDFRGQKLATKILLKLREGEVDRGFGILSSHPAAILAALRAFGRGIEEFNLPMVKEHVSAIMQSSPVDYVKEAKPKGSLFGQDNEEGVVCCADTNFWVDHAEPMAALEQVKNKGVNWPFGELPEGCEFLVFVKGAEVNQVGERVKRKQHTSDF